MIRNIHFLHLPIIIAIIAGSIYISPYLFILAFILPLTNIYLSAKKISFFSVLSITTLNTLFYVIDVISQNTKLFGISNDLLLKFQNMKIVEIISVNIIFNILFIISCSIILNLKFKQEDDFSGDMIKKFQKEKEDFIKDNSDINHRLKDYKLDFSQKLSIIRKLIELGNSNSKESGDAIISVLKNVLDLKNFAFFKFSEKNNSFVKLYDNNVDMSLMKKSSFLKWVLERANNFPSNINILTKEILEKNPEFGTILKSDKNIPDLFIAVKSGIKLHGFILAYDIDKKQDNDFRALAQLVAEILVLILNIKKT
ncbi:MAG: hypothetical protein M0R46_07535 [Candidatus Muirbacterium halophilum]|nr:hypothetical protein [Candidatus Muirbacterium halophilum]MCK9475752.1 hypothetical protein [Candidatus Muirbacterium halophilum]